MNRAGLRVGPFFQLVLSGESIQLSAPLGMDAERPSKPQRPSRNSAMFSNFSKQFRLFLALLISSAGSLATAAGTALYVQSNVSGANRIAIILQDPVSGGMTYQGDQPTGGEGDAAIGGLQSHSIIADGGYLFVTNAGSNSISVFQIGNAGSLLLKGTFSSSGIRPVSLAVHGAYLIVVNQGNERVGGGVRVFHIDPSGQLVPLPGGIDYPANDLPNDIVNNQINGYFAVSRFGGNAIDHFLIGGDGSIQFSGRVTGVANAFGGAMGLEQDARLVFTHLGKNPGLISLRVDAEGQTLNRWVKTRRDLVDPCWATAMNDGNQFWLSAFKTRKLSLYSVLPSGNPVHVSDYASPYAGLGGLDVQIDPANPYIFQLFVPQSSKSLLPPILAAFKIDLLGRKRTAGVNPVSSQTLPLDWANGATTGLAVVSVPP